MDIYSQESVDVLTDEKVQAIHTGGNSAIFAAGRKVFTVTGVLDAKEEPKQFFSLIPSFSSSSAKIIPGLSIADQIKASHFCETEFDANVDRITCGFDHFLIYTKNVASLISHQQIPPKGNIGE